MERFRYEPSRLSVSATVYDEAVEEDKLIDEDIDGYKIFDIFRGNTDDVWCAFAQDVDTAERLVRLLNEDERHKAHVAFLRGGDTLPASSDLPQLMVAL